MKEINWKAEIILETLVFIDYRFDTLSSIDFKYSD